MNRFMISTFALIFCGLQSGAQKSSSKADGPCSVSVVGSHNNVYMNGDCNLSQKDAEQIKNLLNRILEREVNPSDLLTILDQIKIGQIRIEDGIVKLSKQISAHTRRYDLDGGLVEELSYGNSVMGDGEYSAFENLQKFRNSHRDEDLKSLAETEIKKAPEWATPHLFLAGYFDAHGLKLKAIEEYQVFLDMSAGNFSYDKAVKIAKQSLARLQSESN